jgi:hypothetical protein
VGQGKVPKNLAYFCCFRKKTAQWKQPPIGADVMIKKNIFAKKIGELLAFLSQNKANLCKNLIITLVFEKNANFLPKIGENRRILRS